MKSCRFTSPYICPALSAQLSLTGQHEPVPRLSRRHPQRIIVRRTDRRAFPNSYRAGGTNGPFAHLNA